MTSKRVLQVSAATLSGVLLAIGVTHPRMIHLSQTIIEPWAYLNAQLTEWCMHLLRMHIWADQTILRTDLYAYEIRAGYHGANVALAALVLSISVAIWKRYRGFALFYMVAASLTAALVTNIVRIILLIRFGPAPSAAAMPDWLRDTNLIHAIVTMILVWTNMMLIESHRHKQQQKMPPLPGSETGAFSEIPPFWHRLFRRQRHIYLFIPMLLLIAFFLYAGRTHRRLALWSQLVHDMAAQGAYEHALKLGHKLTPLHHDNTAWQLQLTRIMLLANQPAAAQEMLADIDTQVPRHDHAAERALLYAYTQILQQHEKEAHIAIQQLHLYADHDPIWHVIFLEMAMAMGQQDDILEHAPLAVQADTERMRLWPALPALQYSSNWRTFLDSTRWITREHIPLETLRMQIMAELQLGHTSAAAERTQFALQRHPDDIRLIAPVLLLTHNTPTEWEPRFTRLIQEVIQTHTAPAERLTVIHAAFAAKRPDLAWRAYQKLRKDNPNCLYADFALIRHHENWFRFRNHYLRLPAASTSASTDIYPYILLGRHIPLFASSLPAIPHSGEFALLLQDEAWMQKQKEVTLVRIQENPSILTEQPILRLHYADLLENTGKLEKAYQQFTVLAHEYPAYHALALHHRARLAAQTTTSWHGYQYLRTVLTDAEPLAPERLWQAIEKTQPQAIIFKDQSVHQLPLITQLIHLQWETRQYLSALATAREGLRRFPESSTLRTMAADILLQLNLPDQALKILQSTTIRRTPETDALEAEALIATHRFSSLPAFRRQRLLPPQASPPQNPPERLTPAEYVLSPMQPEQVFLMVPSTNNPIHPLFKHVRDNPGTDIDFDTWLRTPESRLQQAEAMHLLSSLLHIQNRTDLARQAAQCAVFANPHDPWLWKSFLRSTTERQPWIPLARTFCAEDPELWLAELVWSARDRANENPPPALDQLIHEAIESDTITVDARVRAADFLWRGGRYDQATTLIESFFGEERGLLAAHLLGIEAAEKSGRQGRALHHMEAAIETAGGAAPGLYARFLKSKAREGHIPSDGNVIHALRNLRAAEPENLFWTELLGYARYQRGGADVIEANQIMQRAIQAGSTNRVVFLIAAEGFRRLNRTTDAADILRQGLEIMPDDPILLNNIAHILATNPATAEQSLPYINTLKPLAETDPVIRETLAFVLLRNDQLEEARPLLARNLQETPPESLTWFRSQMHFSEIVWRQGRREVAISMLEQLLHGARNIPDEDILHANRLLLRFRTAR